MTTTNDDDALSERMTTGVNSRRVVVGRRRFGSNARRDETAMETLARVGARGSVARGVGATRGDAWWVTHHRRVRQRRTHGRRARVVSVDATASTASSTSSSRPSPRVVARTVALATVALGASTLVGDASAASNGFAVGGGDGFVGAPDFASEDYVYQTPDLAVDLASPLVAYRLVTTALRQEVPAWLDAIIFLAALGAAYVVFTDNHALDSVLV